MMQSTQHLDLLPLIEAHIQRNGMKPTRFGKLAMGDPNLIGDLRSGREFRRATISRVMEFMLTGKTHSEAKEAKQ